MKRSKKSTKLPTSKLDQLFDDNQEDILQHFDTDNIRRPGREQQRVNVDFPAWMVQSLDKEANRLGVTRQSLIKMWLAERLER